MNKPKSDFWLNTKPYYLRQLALKLRILQFRQSNKSLKHKSRGLKTCRRHKRWKAICKPKAVDDKRVETEIQNEKRHEFESHSGHKGHKKNKVIYNKTDYIPDTLTLLRVADEDKQKMGKFNVTPSKFEWKLKKTLLSMKQLGSRDALNQKKGRNKKHSECQMDDFQKKPGICISSNSKKKVFEWCDYLEGRLQSDANLSNSKNTCPSEISTEELTDESSQSMDSRSKDGEYEVDSFYKNSVKFYGGENIKDNSDSNQFMADKLDQDKPEEKSIFSKASGISKTCASECEKAMDSAARKRMSSSTTEYQKNIYTKSMSDFLNKSETGTTSRYKTSKRETTPDKFKIAFGSKIMNDVSKTLPLDMGYTAAANSPFRLKPSSKSIIGVSKGNISKLNISTNESKSEIKYNSTEGHSNNKLKPKNKANKIPNKFKWKAVPSRYGDGFKPLNTSPISGRTAFENIGKYKENLYLESKAKIVGKSRSTKVMSASVTNKNSLDKKSTTSIKSKSGVIAKGTTQWNLDDVENINDDFDDVETEDDYIMSNEAILPASSTDEQDDCDESTEFYIEKSKVNILKDFNEKFDAISRSAGFIEVSNIKEIEDTLKPKCDADSKLWLLHMKPDTSENYKYVLIPLVPCKIYDNSPVIQSSKNDNEYVFTSQESEDSLDSGCYITSKICLNKTLSGSKIRKKTKYPLNHTYLQNTFSKRKDRSIKMTGGQSENPNNSIGEINEDYEDAEMKTSKELIINLSKVNDIVLEPDEQLEQRVKTEYDTTTSTIASGETVENTPINNDELTSDKTAGRISPMQDKVDLKNETKSNNREIIEEEKYDMQKVINFLQSKCFENSLLILQKLKSLLLEIESKCCENQKPVPEEIPVNCSKNEKPVSEIPVNCSENKEPVPEGIPVNCSENQERVPEEIPVKCSENQESVPEEIPANCSENQEPVSEIPVKCSENQEPVSEIPVNCSENQEPESEIPVKCSENQEPVPEEIPVNYSENQEPVSEIPVKCSENQEPVSEEIPVNCFENQEPVPEEIPVKSSENQDTISEELPVISQPPNKADYFERLDFKNTKDVSHLTSFVTEPTLKYESDLGDMEETSNISDEICVLQQGRPWEKSNSLPNTTIDAKRIPETKTKLTPEVVSKERKKGVVYGMNSFQSKFIDQKKKKVQSNNGRAPNMPQQEKERARPNENMKLSKIPKSVETKNKSTPFKKYAGNLNNLHKTGLSCHIKKTPTPEVVLKKKVKPTKKATVVKPEKKMLGFHFQKMLNLNKSVFEAHLSMMARLGYLQVFTTDNMFKISDLFAQRDFSVNELAGAPNKLVKSITTDGNMKQAMLNNAVEKVMTSDSLIFADVLVPNKNLLHNTSQNTITTEQIKAKNPKYNHGNKCKAKPPRLDLTNKSRSQFKDKLATSEKYNAIWHIKCFSEPVAVNQQHCPFKVNDLCSNNNIWKRSIPSECCQGLRRMTICGFMTTNNVNPNMEYVSKQYPTNKMEKSEIKLENACKSKVQLQLKIDSNSVNKPTTSGKYNILSGNPTFVLRPEAEPISGNKYCKNFTSQGYFMPHSFHLLCNKAPSHESVKTDSAGVTIMSVKEIGFEPTNNLAKIKELPVLKNETYMNEYKRVKELESVAESLSKYASNIKEKVNAMKSAQWKKDSSTNEETYKGSLPLEYSKTSSLHERIEMGTNEKCPSVEQSDCEALAKYPMEFKESPL